MLWVRLRALSECGEMLREEQTSVFVLFLYCAKKKQPAFFQRTAATQNRRNHSIKSSRAAGEARLKTLLFPPTSTVGTQKEFLQELNSPSGPSSARTKSDAVSVGSID